MAGDKVKQAFLDTLKGKDVARDMFGEVIGEGDILVWGTGSQAAAGVNVGRVSHINYKDDKVSSVSVKPITKSYSWAQHKKLREGTMERPPEVNGYHIGFGKGVTSWKRAMVLKETPRVLQELFDDDA